MTDHKETGNGKTTFSAPKCRVETVVVYLDRAEVCRSLKTKVIEGQNEILITDLPSFVDKDSIRVEGRGQATISEVAYQSKYLGPDDATTAATKTKQEELQNELDQHNVRLEALQAKHKRLTKQRQVLEGFADKAVTGPIIPDEHGNKKVALGEESIKGMENFLDMFDKQTSRLDDSLHALNQEIKRQKELITAVQSNLSGMNRPPSMRESREISVLLDATEACEVELFVSYVVSQASWTPKYDTRVFSNDNQLKILYYGMIQQSTGEDWEDAKLCLSTATPSVGGTCPTLPTQKLHFKPKPEPAAGLMSGFVNRAMGSVAMAPPPPPPPPGAMAKKARGPQMEMAMCAPPPMMAAPVAKVRDSVANTMYEIARRSTIPSDNTAHKVSVAIIDLKPALEYACVPRISTHAYLKAKVKNTSPYALLPGPTNIFLDNNFICKADMDAVSPQEEFQCSLGVDPAIKVDYKPVHKFREQSGLLSKVVNTSYKQVIEMRNTRKDTIKIQVSDQLPESTEEKIKVHLLEPAVKTADKTTRINKNNNVEWDLQLGAGETRELLLRYSIEHPANETLDTIEAYNKSDK